MNIYSAKSAILGGANNPIGAQVATQSRASALLGRLENIDRSLSEHSNRIYELEQVVVGCYGGDTATQQAAPSSEGFLGQLDAIVSSIEMHLEPIESCAKRIRAGF